VANSDNTLRYQKFCKDQRLPGHPARMPDKIPEFFIKFLTDENDLVMDPFAGSNTTGATAERLGRRWLSIEALPHYAAASVAHFDERLAGSLIKEMKEIVQESIK